VAPAPDLPFRWRIWGVLLATAAITWFYDATLAAFVATPWRFPLVIALSLATWLALVRTFVGARGRERDDRPEVEVDGGPDPPDRPR
jgi:hypothetical protein